MCKPLQKLKIFDILIQKYKVRTNFQTSNCKFSHKHLTSYKFSLHVNQWVCLQLDRTAIRKFYLLPVLGKGIPCM